MSIRDQIQDAQKITVTELFQAIGKRSYLFHGHLILKNSSSSPERDEKRGREVFTHLLPQIKHVICDRWNACEKLSRFPDETALGIAIAETLSANNVAPMPMAAITLLTLHIGIKQLCNCA